MNNLILQILLPVAGLAVGVGGGYYLRKFLVRKKSSTLEAKAQKIIEKAEAEKQDIILSAKNQAVEILDKAKKEIQEKENYLLELEKDLRRKEAVIDRKSEDLTKEAQDLESKINQVNQIRSDLAKAKEEQQQLLEKIAKIDREQAKKILLDQIEKEYQKDLVGKINEIKKMTQEEAEKEAREIISIAIERLASETTAESTVATIQLPSDEMKGRIIGREGRNIQAFEKVAGVDVIIDDTPEAVVISCFDPIRRQVAKLALEKLVADGRIHPARIEEALQKAKEEISNQIKEAGEAAIFEVGVAGLHPDLIRILGRLKFRTSYGQNVLKHSVEVAHLAGLLAAELGANVNIAKKAGLLHDIGKAVDHEVPGSHALISRDIAKKYGLSDEVVHAIEAHHEEVEQKTTEAVIVDAADAISGSRPGARRESLESYLKRLEDLENVANSFEGVEKSYAIQAGREIRIIVQPEDIDDLKAEKLSHEIARKIEKDLEYPGQIKVNVIRETRAIDFAK